MLEVTWAPGDVATYPLRALRGECHCAACVDERTGRRILDRASIPEDLTIRDMSLVGRYAVQFTWSDGHDTGLYTWEHLRAIRGNRGGSLER